MDDAKGLPAKPLHQRILQENGAATGRIKGINHLVLFVDNMDAGVRFYRDIMGLRVVRTQRFVTAPESIRTAIHHSAGLATHDDVQSAISVEFDVRQVFFEMGNDGSLFSIYEVPEMEQRPHAPIASLLWPEENKRLWSKPEVPQKLDHLAFDVPTHADVHWFRKHFLDNGIACSEVSERRGANGGHKFISSIYFADPAGNPLEISSMEAVDADWQGYDFASWFMDKEPVPALLDPNAARETLLPRWIGKAGCS